MTSLGLAAHFHSLYELYELYGLSNYLYCIIGRDFDKISVSDIRRSVISLF